MARAPAESLTDAQLLREVVNTVGQRGKLGAGVRCIVSVSMLTEGWDANTVTHIVGVRAFGSQLLCEQVAGRALRRRSYFLAPYDSETGEQLPQNTRRTKDVVWKFPPEYAHIIGVPFKLFKGGKTTTPPPVEMTRVFPIRDRAETCEISFPNIEGYRVEYPEGPLTWDFSKLPDYTIDGSTLPTKTILSSVGGGKEAISIESVLSLRDQEIVYRIAKDLLRDHFPEKTGTEGLQLNRFHEVRKIVAEWVRDESSRSGKGNGMEEAALLPKSQGNGRSRRPGNRRREEEATRIRPILNHYNPTSCTCFVRGQTTKETYETRHSHVNVVVIDSGWEGKLAKTLDDLAEEGLIVSWVKNSFLNFRIPYTANDGRDRDYYPDFIVHARLAGGFEICLILEVSGFRSDKTAKKWAVEHRWLPSANAVHRRLELLPWDFMELASEVEIADARKLVLERLQEIGAQRVPRGFGAWKHKNIDGLEYQRAIREEWDAPASN